MNTKLATHPFAQIESSYIEQVSGGGVPFKFITFGINEDGDGPIYTTMATGEEGGHDLPPPFTDM